MSMTDLLPDHVDLVWVQSEFALVVAALTTGLFVAVLWSVIFMLKDKRQ